MKCSQCHREIEPGGITWPDESHRPDICQDCWEKECAEMFWEQIGDEDINNADI